MDLGLLRTSMLPCPEVLALVARVPPNNTLSRIGPCTLLGLDIIGGLLTITPAWLELAMPVLLELAVHAEKKSA